METSGRGMAPQQRHSVLRDADIPAVSHHNTVLVQRASESHRELAQTRLRHADALRIEMEGVRGSCVSLRRMWRTSRGSSETSLAEGCQSLSLSLCWRRERRRATESWRRRGCGTRTRCASRWRECGGSYESLRRMRRTSRGSSLTTITR